jgi:hypothetical protein
MGSVTTIKAIRNLADDLPEKQLIPSPACVGGEGMRSPKVDAIGRRTTYCRPVCALSACKSASLRSVITAILRPRK